MQVFPNISKRCTRNTRNTKYQRSPGLGPARLPLGILYLSCIPWIYLDNYMNIFVINVWYVCWYIWYIFP